MSSKQLQNYLTLRFVDEMDREGAAAEAGFSLVEAELTDKAVARGDIVVPSKDAGSRLGSALERPRAHLGSGTPAPPPPPAPASPPPAQPPEPAQEGETTMARKAQAANDEVEEVQKPDFVRAANILRGDVKPAEEANAKSRGDLSAAWKTIEQDCHVNKKAAKDAYRLLNMSPELRDDYLRSLYGMMQEMNIGISRDLVDQMGDGEVPTMPVSDRPAVETADLAAVAAE